MYKILKIKEKLIGKIAVCVCVYVHVCRCMYLCVHAQRPEEDFQCAALSHIPLLRSLSLNLELGCCWGCPRNPYFFYFVLFLIMRAGEMTWQGRMIWYQASWPDILFPFLFLLPPLHWGYNYTFSCIWLFMSFYVDFKWFRIPLWVQGSELRSSCFSSSNV